MIKLKYKIDTRIFDELVGIRDDLPEYATGAKDGNNHKTPAGLALLGRKNETIDMVVNLRMAGGCWDAPEITYENMDKGLKKVLKKDRVVTGMALIRHPDWEPYGQDKSKISNDLRRHIVSFKNCFEDIEQTVWITTADDTFKTYRVIKDKEGRLFVRETKTKGIFEEHKTNQGLYEDAVRIEQHRKEEKKKLKMIEKQKQEKIEETRKKKEVQENKKRIGIDKSLKEKKDSIIPIGNGMCFMKDNKGNYILWQDR